LIKKDEQFNKYYKNIQFLKISKGDIIGLEAIDTQPTLTYAMGKDKTCKLEKLSIKRVNFGCSLKVNFINLG
jgi:hypothetical protein